MKRQPMVQKELKCEVCGDIFPIFRKAWKNKESGHIKHLYCYKCKNITAHIELSPLDLYEKYLQLA
jgi:hypothetical protein